MSNKREWKSHKYIKKYYKNGKPVYVYNNGSLDKRRDITDVYKDDSDEENNLIETGYKISGKSFRVDKDGYGEYSYRADKGKDSLYSHDIIHYKHKVIKGKSRFTKTYTEKFSTGTLSGSSKRITKTTEIGKITQYAEKIKKILKQKGWIK